MGYNLFQTTTFIIYNCILLNTIRNGQTVLYKNIKITEYIMNNLNKLYYFFVSIEEIFNIRIFYYN